VLVPTVELELRRRSLTLGIEGPLPEESVSAWLARGAPGARDHADDPVDQLVAGMEAVLPDGREMDVRPAPRRAVGPDLVGAFVGARAALGIVTGAHLVARPLTDAIELAFRFPSLGAAHATRAWIRGSGVRPASTAVVEADGEIALRLRLDGLPALREASEHLVRRTAAARGGVAIDPAGAPAKKRAAELPASDIVRRLAARLDRAGALS
jgi:FAD/FMN-containing dehydrogenase